ncbi:MAG TPA: hypothetical protein VFM05_12125 [Candidatus Saccharimonadales bacterium]|nr:hypothetical protein [Candidatus Saccharimonadales bacterium]
MQKRTVTSIIIAVLIGISVIGAYLLVQSNTSQSPNGGTPSGGFAH